MLPSLLLLLCLLRPLSSLPMPPSPLPSLSPLLTPGTRVLCDIWGILHDGVEAYPGVIPALEALSAAGVPVTLLSNSSKRVASTVAALTSLGIPPPLYSSVVTSGEVTHAFLSSLRDLPHSPSLLPPTPPLPISATAPAAARPLRCLLFGNGSDDAEYLLSCGLAQVSDPAAADFVLARGTATLPGGGPPPPGEGYLPAARKLLARLPTELPMLVSNPDLVRPDEGLTPMPGRLGACYAALGGRVGYVGKPGAGVFEVAMRGEPGGEWLMLGDALGTDVRGGGGRARGRFGFTGTEFMRGSARRRGGRGCARRRGCFRTT